MRLLGRFSCASQQAAGPRRRAGAERCETKDAGRARVTESPADHQEDRRPTRRRGCSQEAAVARGCRRQRARVCSAHQPSVPAWLFAAHLSARTSGAGWRTLGPGWRRRRRVASRPGGRHYTKLLSPLAVRLPAPVQIRVYLSSFFRFPPCQTNPFRAARHGGSAATAAEFTLSVPNRFPLDLGAPHAGRL